MAKRAKRKRRSFTPEFKAEIVELCHRGDRSIGEVSRDFDLTETAVRRWVRLTCPSQTASVNVAFSLDFATTRNGALIGLASDQPTVLLLDFFGAGAPLGISGAYQYGARGSKRRPWSVTRAFANFIPARSPSTSKSAHRRGCGSARARSASSKG